MCKLSVAETCKTADKDFFFGLATAPAHVEDDLNDSWLEFAKGHDDVKPVIIVFSPIKCSYACTPTWFSTCVTVFCSVILGCPWWRACPHWCSQARWMVGSAGQILAQYSNSRGTLTFLDRPQSRDRVGKTGRVNSFPPGSWLGSDCSWRASKWHKWSGMCQSSSLSLPTPLEHRPQHTWGLELWVKPL